MLRIQDIEGTTPAELADEGVRFDADVDPYHRPLPKIKNCSCVALSPAQRDEEMRTQQEWWSQRKKYLAQFE